MGHMNDFFGKPLFQPTGTDWIDHAFTAAVLDDIEREERERRASEFNAFVDKLNAPISAESEATVEDEECIIYGEKYDLSSVLPFSLKHDHSTAMEMIEQITGISHADAMKLELRICQRGFIPLEYPDSFEGDGAMNVPPPAPSSAASPRRAGLSSNVTSAGICGEDVKEGVNRLVQNFDLVLDNDSVPIHVEPPHECPMCHRLHNLTPISTFAERCEYDIVAAIFTYHCNGCDEIFFARYNAVQNGRLLEDPELEYVIPESLAPLSLSPEIQELSPKFATIYTQAQKAESDGLTEVFGMAYGKSAEFLVKDYLIKVQGEDASKIGPMWMKECIMKIQDERINTLAKGTSWLRNDETHYIRKNENYDTKKLKAFIKALIHFIESDLTFREAEKLVGGT